MTEAPVHVLVVGQEEAPARNLCALLEGAPGLPARCTHTRTPEAALELLSAEPVDVILLHDAEPGTCLAFLTNPVARQRAIPVVVVAEHPTVTGDEEAIRAGAADYLPARGLDAAGLGRTIRHSVARARRAREDARIHFRTERALRERVKELRTLNLTGYLLSRRDLPMEDRLQKIVDEIPGGWHTPAWTEARVTLAGRSLQTPGFRPTRWMLSAPIPAEVPGEVEGRLEVALTREVTIDGVEGPFLPEERQLVHNLGRIIGETLTRERSAQVLSQTLASIAEGVLIMDSLGNERRVRYMNPAAERMFGWSSDAWVGDTPERAHPDRASYERYGALARSALATDGTFRGTFTLRRKDGSLFEAEQTVSLLDPDAGAAAGFVVVVRDVSDRARTERALRESEERFRQIAEHVNDAFWITNADKSVIEYVSPAYARIWGRSTASLHQDPSSWLAAILPEDRVHIEAASQRQGNGGYDVSYRIRRPDGTIRWIHDRAFPVTDAEGRVTRLIGVAADITERRMAEERFRVLGEETTDVIMVVGGDGTALFMSPSIEALTQHRADELVGTKAVHLVHPDDRPYVEGLLARVAATPGETARAEFRLVRKDGTEREVESVARNLSDHPAVSGIVVTTRDISERLLLERRIRQGQKMEAIGQLAGGIAHDFNNILTVIRSETELLLLDHSGTPLAEDLEVIRGAADRAALLVSQLLAFSREQILRPRRVELGQIVRDIAPLIERAAGDAVSVAYVLEDAGTNLSLDPDQLQQVVLNLVLNAGDAMPQGGSVTIVTGVETLDATQVAGLPGLGPGRYAFLRVADTGTGMSPQIAGRIFDPFFTTKPKGRGTGLGLATAYGFMKQSGGGIHVDTAVGAGSTFHLRFPLGPAETDTEGVPENGSSESSAATPGASGAPASDPPPDPRPPLVLIADDEPAVLQVTHRVLTRAGYDAVAVGDTDAAVGALSTGRKVDLLLTDLDLPAAGGGAVIAMARSLRAALPVVVMSGHADPESVTGDAALGEDGAGPILYLEKPFTRDELLATVRSALDGEA